MTETELSLLDISGLEGLDEFVKVKANTTEDLVGEVV